jgi:GH35 family endo-1,4-beta-xylanase
MKKLLTGFLVTLTTLIASAQDFPVVTKAHGATPIYVDPHDHWLVRKAAQWLQEDIERVTGVKPSILDTMPRGNNPLIIIGSYDSSHTIRNRFAHNLSLSSGKWEAYTRAQIASYYIIAGSDRRGTAYGVLDLSRQIGVSPWYYWADVPTAHKDELWLPRNSVVSSSPSVKYRGFFINDEAPALSGWVHEKFGNFNHLFYEKVFELLLRLKGNYLWPAMWGNAFNDDDSLNPVLASQYGIVMGTSHHEPMLRAQQEWKRYGHGPWDYSTNAGTLDSFWTIGIQHMDHHESIVTVGMRGDGDKPMTEGSNIQLLEKIVADQRAILQKVTGKPASATPQSWALYKEVQDYYDKGMRVPDDVTLLLCDDNWGDVRKLPLLTEKRRAGGYGLYYHFDYVGGPRNYKWINTNQISRAWEELHLTKAYGVDHIWIVNVGDIKPLEFPTQFFLDYAWDPAAIPAERLPDYTYRWAADQFGSDHAAAIADILEKYTKYNARRKPELLSPDTYSLLDYREAETVVADYNTLAEKAKVIGRQLPAGYQDAYFELVLYPVLASANLYELYYTAARNKLYASQGRAATNDLAEKVKTLFQKDSLLALTYNRDIAGGKWHHMMDQTHIGYTYWQEPRHNNMPKIDTIDLAAATGPAWGMTVEGSAFNPYDGQAHCIDIYSRRNSPISFTTQSGAPWLTVAPASGTVTQEQRIWITVDWSRVPADARQATFTITGDGGAPVPVTIPLDRPGPPASFKGFLETNGYVSIDAEHYSKAFETAGIRWQIIPGLGRTGSAVEAMPITAPSVMPDRKSPRLEYEVYLADTGTVTVHTYLSPILEFNRKPIHYAIAFDDGQPQLIDCSSGNESPRVWNKMVADNIRIVTSTHHIGKPGAHTLKFFFVDPGPVLQKLVIDAGGAKPGYLGPPESPHLPIGLAAAYKNYFPIGVAVSPRSLSGPDSALILRQFNSLTAENAMKMGPIHPREDYYYWKDADAIVDFAQRHGLKVRGHNLCWHEQTPAWLFRDSSGNEVTKEVLLQRLKDHITAVVSRYKGKIYAWDVVNEAVADDSAGFLRNSPWLRICGPEFIAKAFEYAHAADPSAQLFYNDYNTERPEKRERIYRLLKQLVDAGVPITGVGLQGHWSIYEPSAKDLESTIRRFSSLGLKVQITELDVSIYPWEKDRRARRPDEEDVYTPEKQQQQAQQYKMVFDILRRERDKVNGVTFWNISDKRTWLDDYPVRGRKNYPLLFDTDNLPKKAYYDVVDF